MSVLEGDEDFTAETKHEPAPPSSRWQVGDQVRVIDGPRMLIGSTGTVVEIDVSEDWSVRVRIDGNGFDTAVLAPHELEPADGATP